MLREVKIHDSALLPKVQFNPGEGGRREGGVGGEERGLREEEDEADFYDRLSPYLEL